MPVTVKVELIGICTHIPPSFISPAPPANVTDRYVLVDASRGASINGRSIPPHDALMAIDPASIESMGPPSAGMREIARGLWQLRGVHLSIEEAELPDEAPKLFGGTEELLPSLLSQANGVPTELDQDVVANGGAACYFDITHGQFSVFKYGEAATSAVYIQTPGRPRLRIYTFWDGSVTHLTLQPPAKIVLRNVGGFEDSTFDFLLHYKVGKTIPPLITPPGPAKSDNLSGLTAGCSNSNYP